MGTYLTGGRGCSCQPYKGQGELMQTSLSLEEGGSLFKLGVKK